MPEQLGKLRRVEQPRPAPKKRKRKVSRTEKLRACAFLVMFGVAYAVAAPITLRQYVRAEQQKAEQTALALEELESTPAEETTEPAQEETEPVDLDAVFAQEEAVEADVDMPLQFVTSDPSYFADALFIGDSRTVGLKNYGHLPDAAFYCTGGLSTTGVLGGKKIEGRTLDDMLQGRDYGKVYIMLGMNEVAGSLDTFYTNIEKLCDKVREAEPQAMIFLMANLHVSTQVSIDRPNIGNSRLDNINSYMESLADGVSVFYLDVNPLFDDEDHALSTDHSGDGIHVGGNDYAAWTDWLCTQTITPDSRRAELHSFSDALTALRSGQSAARVSWLAAGEKLYLLTPSADAPVEAEILPYLAILKNNTLSPWNPTPEDVLASDWVIS